jgi:hypothetical protein
MKREQDEKHVAALKLEKLTALMPEILDVAEKLDALIQSSDAEILEQAARTYVDRGLDLAAALESGGGTATLVLEYEEKINATSTMLKQILEDEKQFRQELSGLLNAAGDVDSADLLKMADAYTVTDSRLARLEELYADWDRRFGRSLDFASGLCIGARDCGRCCGRYVRGRSVRSYGRIGI